MTAAWPGGVNQNAQVRSYGEAPDDNVARFNPEVGPPKTRRRMSISTDTLSFDLILTSSEYDTFIAFFRSTIIDGTLPFTFTHPRTSVVTTFVFVSPPKLSALSANYYNLAMSIQSVP